MTERVALRGVWRGTRSDAGMSIVEVVVAMAVFSVGILAIAKTMDTAFATADRTSHRSKALAVATKHLEELRATRFDQLPTSMETGADPVGNMTWERTVTDVSGAPYKKAIVAVRWTDGAGGHEINQTSYLYPTASPASDAPAPSGVVGVGPSLSALSQIDATGRGTLTWTPPANVAGQQVGRFIIQRALNNTFTGHVWTMTEQEPPNSRSFDFSGLAAGTDYFFRIRAVYLDGSLSQWSPVQQVSTAASAGTAACEVRRVSTSPSSVARVAPYPSQLEAAPVVVAETNGRCTGLLVHYDGPSGDATPIPLTGSGGVLTATISNTSAAQWQLGQYGVAVKSATNQNYGTSSFIVCEQGTC
ncbi:MAG TPA: fibronectin type III domain-containing protein [Acidimicrobiales bacterium]|jgi:Tfp pilus assembly protein PilV|nr:fibronectin type III domain-containing protein [Acidimicrobiales bacterium]